MSTTEARADTTPGNADAAEVPLKFGWRLDADLAIDKGFRVVQYPPSGSCCTQVTTWLPGRTDTAQTSYASVSDLPAALGHAAPARGERDKRTGGADEDWRDWYSAYMVAEQSSEERPQ